MAVLSGMKEDASLSTMLRQVKPVARGSQRLPQDTRGDTMVDPIKVMMSSFMDHERSLHARIV